METSGSIAAVAAALVKVQAEIANPKNSAVNPFLKNHYAPLPEILAEVRPMLAKHGLAVVQTVTGADGTIGVVTMLLHSSGEWIRDQVSMSAGEEKGKSSAQVAGSIVTYLRRYAITAILGISGEDDTDGSRPESKPKAPAKPQETLLPIADEIDACQKLYGMRGKEMDEKMAAFFKSPAEQAKGKGARAAAYLKTMRELAIKKLDDRKKLDAAAQPAFEDDPIDEPDDEADKQGDIF